MKILFCSFLILLGVPAFGATVKYYDDYPDNANPPGTFKLSIQTLDKTQGGIPYNYMTLDQFVDWLGVSGFTNGSGTIIVTNASFQYITNLYAYLTNIFSTNIITTNLFATFESITYATNVTLSVSNFSYTISKGGSLISTNTSFFTTNIVNTTINTNNSFVNNEYVTNLTVVVPGGLTNLNATPKTAAWWDPNDALQSIPNASGVFTNNGSGDMGWSSTFSLTELDVQNAYLTNTFLIGLTNKLLSTDGNGQATNAVTDTATLSFSANKLSVVDSPLVTQPPILSFASDSNSITMSTNINNVYFFVANKAVSLTNVIGAIAGQMTYADFISSNSLATSITNYETIPGAKIFGVNSATTATNAIIIPAAKEAYWHVECRGINETNVFVCLQQ